LSYAFLRVGAAMTSQQKNPGPSQGAREVRRAGPSNLVPMLVVLFAVLSAVVLFAMDRDSGSSAPKPNYRADAPAQAPAAPR
jgi:hypothetical protein